MLFVFLSWTGAAQATPCGSVSNTVETLNVFITGAPRPVSLAVYDMVTKGLAVSYTNGETAYLYGVPNNLVIGHVYVTWATLNQYPRALMQERSTCPLLTTSGVPLFIGRGRFPTVTPHVASQCPSMTGADPITLVGIMNPPVLVYQATYDAKLQWLFVQFVGGGSMLFTNVPTTAFKSYALQWNNLAGYPTAVMIQGDAACPLLGQP
jgi:hypothetical protein